MDLSWARAQLTLAGSAIGTHSPSVNYMRFKMNCNTVAVIGAETGRRGMGELPNNLLGDDIVNVPRPIFCLIVSCFCALKWL